MNVYTHFQYFFDVFQCIYPPPQVYACSAAFTRLPLYFLGVFLKHLTPTKWWELGRLESITVHEFRIHRKKTVSIWCEAALKTDRGHPRHL